MTKLQLGHANVFEALLRQRGIQLESRFLPTRRLTKLELRGQVRDQAGAWSRGCKARLTGRTPAAFSRAAQPGRDGTPCRPGRAQRGGWCRGAHASSRAGEVVPTSRTSRRAEGQTRAPSLPTPQEVRRGGTPRPARGTRALPGTRRLADARPADGTECRPYPAAPTSHRACCSICANGEREHQRCEDMPAQGNALGTRGENDKPCRGGTCCFAPSARSVSTYYPGRCPGLACRRAFGPPRTSQRALFLDAS